MDTVRSIDLSVRTIYKEPHHIVLISPQNIRYAKEFYVLWIGYICRKDKSLPLRTEEEEVFTYVSLFKKLRTIVGKY